MKKWMFFMILAFVYNNANSQRPRPMSVHHQEVKRPSFVIASDGKPDKIVVVWEDMKSTKGYIIHRGENLHYKKKVEWRTKTQGIINNSPKLIKDLRYYYKVKRIAKTGMISEFSMSDSGYIKGGIASVVPSLLLPAKEVIIGEQTQFKWSSVSNATQYRVQIVAEAGSAWNETDGLQNSEEIKFNQVTDNPNVTIPFQGNPNERYLWSVATIVGDSTSSFSYPRSFRAVEEPLLSTNRNFGVSINQFKPEINIIKHNTDFGIKVELENSTSNNINNCGMAFFISKDQSWSSDDKKIGSTHLFDMVGGEEKHMTPIKRIHSDIENGNYWLIAMMEENGVLNRRRYQTVQIEIE